MEYYITNGIYHSGILGMKWGQRRYQYADGSLTPEGRKRYAANSKTKKSTTASPDVKNVKEMTNQELQEFVTRSNLEKQYLQAVASSQINKGQTLTEAALSKFGNSLLNTVATKTGEAVGKKIVARVFGDDSSSKKK